MTNKRVLVCISILGVVLILLATVGTVLGQSPDDKPPDSGTGTEETVVTLYDETNNPEQIEGPADTEFILAQPPHTMNYQGYLTDSGGNPLNGSYNLVFQLHNDELAGTTRWGPETHNGISVANGLFQVALGSSVTLPPSHFDEALFLSVEVNGTMVAPRQPLRAVPYAFGLVPGAEVEGDPILTNYALRVDNTGEAATDRGLYVSGEQYGIYAEEVGSESDIGIYSPDYIYAKGFRSVSDSYLWVPGTAGMLYPSASCTLYQNWHGSIRLQCSSAGSKIINIPITVPGPLYGQNVRVESIQVYYDLDHTGSYIDATRLRKFTATDASDELINDGTNRLSTSATDYSLSATGNYTITSSAGALNLNLAIWHDGDVNHDVHIGGVRIQLGHTD